MNKFIVYVVVLCIACGSSVYAESKADYEKGNEAFRAGSGCR